MRHALFSAGLISVLSVTSVNAQPLHKYGDLAIAPAGDQVASVETVGDTGRGAVVVRDARDGHVIRIISPCATCSFSGLTYRSDGTLAYLQRESGTMKLVVNAGSPRVLAVLKGIAKTPRFSPDGKRIALLVTLGASKESGATQAGVRQVGEIGKHSDDQRIAVFDVAKASLSDASLRLISPAGRYVYEYDWTPDGRSFVASTALGDGDANWWVATLDAIDADGGGVRQIAAPLTQVSSPRISPDGTTVAYIGGLMSDFGSVGGDVWTVPFSGGDPVDITQGSTSTVTSLRWTRTGLFTTRLSGEAAEIALLAKSAPAKIVWRRAGMLNAGDGHAAYDADGGVIATVVQDFSHAPAIFTGGRGGLRAITHDNDAQKPIANEQSVTWTNDGLHVQGWLLAPVGADPRVKHPMIVNVHGGPASAWVPNFISETGIVGRMLNAGYYVFFPNPRGSYGQGEAFTAANKRDFGGGDLRDILTGVDAVERNAPVDDSRLGLLGCSYGGFMAMWANTQTNRFKAIVAGAGLSDWVSYYGTNGIDQWMLPYFGKTMYQDRKAYEKVSAVYTIEKAKTPTFIYAGERDVEVPPTQSVEFWHALKDQGVPTSLVIYPDAGHCLPQREQAADMASRSVAWFDRYIRK